MVGYTPDNPTDNFKKYNLWLFISEISNCKNFKFFELQSGEGLYRKQDGSIHEGSSILVLNTIQNRAKEYEAYLNEKNPKRRRKLDKIIQSYYENVKVDGKWQKSFRKYMRFADKNSFFFIDPTYISDYKGKNGIIKKLPKILRTKARVGVYVPETISIKAHNTIINTIEDIIKFSGREFVHLTSNENNTRGYFKRIDHLYFV